MACAANKSRVWLCGWRAGGVHKCCCGGARRDRLALRLWRTQGMVCEAARTMRMPQGTRGTAHTSPLRSNESSPKLNMTVDEQLPPVRTGAGGADGQGSTVLFRSGGLTLRNSHCVRCPRKTDVHGRGTARKAPPPPRKHFGLVSGVWNGSLPVWMDRRSGTDREWTVRVSGTSLAGGGALLQ